MCFAALALMALLAVACGEAGIGRMQVAEVPPFQPPNTFWNVFYGMPIPPQKLVLAWHSQRFIAWSACAVIPAISGLLVFRQRTFVVGWLILMSWCGVTMFYGFWIWFFSVFCAIPFK